MGCVSPFPYERALALASQFGITAFVETGTFHGDTTRWAARHFAEVHTIERSPELYLQYQHTWATNVHAHLGNSRELLAEVRRRVGRKAMYWLDGHWSCGATAGQDDECPLLAELACLDDDDVVLIDDARYFVSPPPPPHNPSSWPTLPEIQNAMSAWDVSLQDDVIFGIPK